MNADQPRDPSADADLERLVAGLDRAAERAGQRDRADQPDDAGQPDRADQPDDAGQPDRADQPDDALVTAVLSQLRAPETWAGPPPSLRAAILAEASAASPTGAARAAPPALPRASQPGRTSRPAEPVSQPVSQPVSRPVTQLVPRWRRMAWAVPAAAAAAVIFTLLVLGGERLLTAPDNGVAYALSGGPGAPDASGTASVAAAAAGFPVVLDVHNLPGAPAGCYYEAWLSRPGQPNPVSLGTFHGRRSGGPIKLWSGVDPAGYTLRVDLESLTDGPGPSGQVFLTAKIG